MNGDRFLLDTNAIIALLNGNTALMEVTQAAKWIGISVISQIEFLCFEGLTREDQELFGVFASRVEVVGLMVEDPGLLSRVVEVRRQTRAKLPDAIIAATAMHHQACIVTADANFPNVKGLTIRRF